MNKKEIKIAVSEALNPFILPMGFKLNKKGADWIYEKQTDFGFNKIYLLFYHYPPMYYVGTCLVLRISEINKHYNHLTHINPDYYNESFTMGVRPTDIGYEDDRFQIISEQDLAAAIGKLKQFLLIDTKHFFEQFTSVSSIDLELNQKDREDKYLDKMRRVQIGLIAAKLNNNPHYTEYLSFFEQQFSGYEWFQRLKQYIETKM